MKWAVLIWLGVLVLQATPWEPVADVLRNADAIVFVSLFFIAMWRRWLRWGFDYEVMKTERDMYRDKVLEQAEKNASAIQSMADTLRTRS